MEEYELLETKRERLLYELRAVEERIAEIEEEEEVEKTARRELSAKVGIANLTAAMGGAGKLYV